MALPRTHEDHISRIETGFRYEEQVESYDEAEHKAIERSERTVKRIFITKILETGKYMINSHGVEKIGEQIIAVFHRGEILMKK